MIYDTHTFRAGEEIVSPVMRAEFGGIAEFTADHTAELFFVLRPVPFAFSPGVAWADGYYPGDLAHPEPPVIAVRRQPWNPETVTINDRTATSWLANQLPRLLPQTFLHPETGSLRTGRFDETLMEKYR